MKKILRRIRALIVLKQKRDHRGWLIRWQAACDRLWIRFYSKPRCKESIEWMERKHAKLLSCKGPFKHLR